MSYNISPVSTKNLIYMVDTNRITRLPSYEINNYLKIIILGHQYIVFDLDMFYRKMVRKRKRH